MDKIINKRKLKNGVYFAILAFSLFINLAVLVCMVKSFSQKDTTEYPDFVMYLTAGYIIRNGEIKNLYEKNTQYTYQKKIVEPGKLNGLLAFRAPPMIAYLFAPLTHLSYAYAFKLMALTNILVILISTYLIYKNWSINKNLLMLLMANCIIFFPAWATISSGQITSFVLLFSILGLLQIKRGKNILGGIFLGFTFLKPQFIIIIPLISATLIKEKKAKKFLVGAVTTLVTLIALNTLLFGPGFISEYPKYLLQSESRELGTDIYKSFNLAPIITEKQTLIMTNTFLYLLALILLKNKGNKPAAYNAITLLTPLINVHTMPTDTLIHLFPLILMLKNDTVFALIVIISYYLFYAELQVLFTIGVILYCFLLLKPDEAE